ncbi:MAG: hypothetical protein V1831_01570 [Candidatus Woesearchaeota archaeon]
MKTKKILLSIFLFLLVFLLVNLSGAQEDFTASTQSSIELCPCSNQAYTIIVQNTGSAASSYRVFAGSDAAEWVTFSPSKFVLNPGQRGSFFVFVNSECNIQGKYDLEVFIATDNGVTKSIKQVLEFSQCYDYSLEQGNVVDESGESIQFLQHDTNYALCKDEQKIMPILITNNENFENRYRMFIDAPEWAALNVDTVKLSGKKSGIFFINLDMAGVEGKFDFKLNTISELGKVQRRKDIVVNVEECYALELEVEKENDVVCSGEDKSYDVLIKNTGTLKQNIKLELDNPTWASLGNISFVELNPQEEKTVAFDVNPGDDVSGSFLVKIIGGVGNKTKFDDQININVMPKWECYKTDISAKTSVTNLYSNDFFFAKVRNDGIKKADYDVSLEGVSWVSVNPENLELNPGQTGNLNLKVSPSEDVEPGTYGIKINADSNGMIYSKNVDIVLKKESEFMKKFKATAKLYQYYIYLFILIIILIVVLRKPLIAVKNKSKKSYEKYKIRREKLEALKIAKEKREEEKEKRKEQREAEKEKARKKELEKESKEKAKKFTEFFKKYKIRVYSLIILAIISLGIFFGHYNKLFNAKYLHLYIKNFFVGYLYYILIGVGVVIALFLLILLFNHIRKRKKKSKVKKEAKKAEKKAKRKEKWYNRPFYVIAVFAPIIILLAAFAYFNLFSVIRDFFVLYLYYIILGIVILIVLILLIRFYKPLFKFLKE